MGFYEQFPKCLRSLEDDVEDSESLPDDDDTTEKRGCWNSLISHARLTEGAALRVRDPEVTEADPGVEVDSPVPDDQPPKMADDSGGHRGNRWLLVKLHLLPSVENPPHQLYFKTIALLSRQRLGNKARPLP